MAGCNKVYGIGSGLNMAEHPIEVTAVTSRPRSLLPRMPKSESWSHTRTRLLITKQLAGLGRPNARHKEFQLDLAKTRA
jgi:hypothetical protein